MEKARQHPAVTGGLRSLALGLALLLACPKPSAAADAIAARANALIAPLNAAGDFSGAVVLGRDGKVLYARGFGFADVEKGVAFTPDTANDGGSLTKPVTAAAVLRLVDQGRVQLDAPVRRYLPEFPHATTTVRHLLSQSAGLPDYADFQTLLDSGRPVDTSDLLAELTRRGTPPAFAPGSAFLYCNLCYDTLALLVERVSGYGFDLHLKSWMLWPLGMNDTFLRPARFSDWPGVRTRAYRRTARGVEPYDALDNEGFYGGGNLYFSARDLHAWVSSFHANPVLSAAVRRQATTPARIAGAASGLTLGNWYCAAGPRCYYTGHHRGFHNFAYWDGPRRLSVVFVSNNTLSAELQPRLARALVAAAEGGPAPPLRQPPGLWTGKVDPAAAAGRYRTADGAVVELVSKGKGVAVRRADGLAYPLYPGGGGVLYAPGLDAYLAFAPAKDEAYPRLHWTTVFEEWDAERAR